MIDEQKESEKKAIGEEDKNERKKSDDEDEDEEDDDDDNDEEIDVDEINKKAQIAGQEVKAEKKDAIEDGWVGKHTLGREMPGSPRE